MFNATLRNPETWEDAINDPRSFLPAWTRWRASLQATIPDYENRHFAKRAIAPKACRGADGQYERLPTNALAMWCFTFVITGLFVRYLSGHSALRRYL
jgi:hypothetical protein